MLRLALSGSLPAAALLALAACSGGGGGGGGGSGTIVTPTPTPAPSATPSPTAGFDTAEYRASIGAVSMNAVTAYNHGATGLGIKVAVIDTGIDIDSPDFTGRIDPESADLVGAGTLDDANGHGTAVAKLLAARRDGAGIHGVAFDATIIAYRVEPACTTSCFLRLSAVAEGVDRARLAGARVINLSMIGDSAPAADMRDAVDRATAAGIVVTICAGNEAQAQPQIWGAALANDAAIARGLVVLVGTVTATDTIQGFSNRAGTSADHFITAYEGSCSAATPLVSGALVLLAQANPSFSGAQLVDRLYSSARDAGAVGIDPIYGRGVIDLTRAF
ncbi:S8 family serine peptidase [Sphingomonas sp. LB-2]|uniref:S8 family peptidase n=1 Tax=Sphingomonas caeni TaxID=2984949 RepID=UPI0022327B67|nr:S8 family peptidase [Sphingomonas caeni]MCW3849276.1 S8 family serine peptidase [Sphingomonas caeni]